MKKFHLLVLAGLLSLPAAARREISLSGNWQFAKVDSNGVAGKWQTVRVPHDWAIHEPFSRDNDLQVVAEIGRASCRERV